MEILCPVCHNFLVRKEKQYVCEKGHSFDISKSGYVNLLLGSSPKNHGDNKLMISARRDFLAKGYYAHLKDAICKTVTDYASENFSILDCGCGEGYYTKAIYESLPQTKIFGFDISKDALSIAARHEKGIAFAVASSFSLPVADESADMVLEIFSPHCNTEFLRVLKPNGILILVFPLENHLWELKKAIYDTPYKNEVSDTDLEGFRLIAQRETKKEIFIDNNLDIQNLFKMTPYYYKTGKEQQKRAEELESLKVQTEFGILVYQKTEY